MITATLGALAAAEPALARLAAEKLPFAVAHRIAKLTKAVAEETRHFQDQRNALVREFGQAHGPGPDDVHVLPTMATWPTFVAQLEALAAVEAPIALDPIDLQRIDGLAISAADLLLLAPLVVSIDPPVAKEPANAPL